MSKLVFEANLLRFDGSVYGIEILTCDSEEDALERASRCATKWSAPIRLYQVPYVNQGSEAWTADDMRFVAYVERDTAQQAVPATVERKQRLALRERAVDAVRNLFGAAARLNHRASVPAPVRTVP